MTAEWNVFFDKLDSDCLKVRKKVRQSARSTLQNWFNVRYKEKLYICYVLYTVLYL